MDGSLGSYPPPMSGGGDEHDAQDGDSGQDITPDFGKSNTHNMFAQEQVCTHINNKVNA
jgi:hypothetical protein